MTDPLYDDEVRLSDGPRLALRRADGDNRRADRITRVPVRPSDIAGL